VSVARVGWVGGVWLAGLVANADAGLDGLWRGWQGGSGGQCWRGFGRAV